MVDECAHPAEGGLERREPIGGFFNIEENICAILLLCWDIPGGQRAEPVEGVESTHIDFDPDYSQMFPISSDFVCETCLCFQSMDVITTLQCESHEAGGL